MSAISKFVETRIHPPTKELFYIWYVGVVNSPSYISVLKKRRLYLDFYLDDSTFSISELSICSKKNKSALHIFHFLTGIRQKKEVVKFLNLDYDKRNY